MNLHTKDADAVMQIEENRYVVPLELHHTYQLRPHAIEQFKWVDGFAKTNIFTALCRRW